MRVGVRVHIWMLMTLVACVAVAIQSFYWAHAHDRFMQRSRHFQVLAEQCEIQLFRHRALAAGYAAQLARDPRGIDDAPDARAHAATAALRHNWRNLRDEHARAADELATLARDYQHAATFPWLDVP